MVLQVYVDDSELFKEPVSALGGFIADVATWESFTKAWSAELQRPPTLRFFKLREAMALKGAFARVARLDKEHRIERFMQIIADHHLEPATVMLAKTAHIRKYMNFPGSAPSMYEVLLYGLIMEVLSYTGHRTKEPVEFIFDEQDGQSKKVLAVWEKFRALNPGLSERLPRAPLFASDQIALPLQAADGLVWYVRRQGIRRINGQAIEPTPFKSRPGVDEANTNFGFISALTEDERELPQNTAGIKWTRGVKFSFDDRGPQKLD